jgi:hypothetical protein
MTRRGTKRKGVEPSSALKDDSKQASSGPIIVNEDLTNNSGCIFPVDAWQQTSNAASSASTATQQHMMDAHAEISSYPIQPPTNATELQYYHYQEFQDWLHRWHIYQHSLTNYWRGYNKDAFNHKYLELVAYKEQHGHCNVPSTYVEEEPLGKWVDRMRTEVREGRLDMAKVEQLRSLGFDFTGED